MLPRILQVPKTPYVFTFDQLVDPERPFHFLTVDDSLCTPNQATPYP